MRKVMIIGSPGAGKSTLALRLSSLLELPIIHLDKYGHDEKGKVTPEAFAQTVSELVQGEKWIMDGHYAKNLDDRLPYADTILFLNFSRWHSLRGAVRRWLRYRGKHRAQIPGWNPARLTWSYLRFIWSFPGEGRRNTLEKMNKYAPEAKTFVFRSPNEVEQWLQAIAEPASVVKE